MTRGPLQIGEDYPPDHDFWFPILRAYNPIWLKYRNITVQPGEDWENAVSRAIETEARQYGGGTLGHPAFAEQDRARAEAEDRRRSAPASRYETSLDERAAVEQSQDYRQIAARSRSR